MKDNRAEFDNSAQLARKAELKANLERVRGEISRLSQEYGVPAPRLLPVTKFHPASDIALLGELGITDVAENREQEARLKASELPDMNFHMIGQIQTKKANHVARWAHSVHSLDSVKLALALDRGVELAIERGQRSGNLPVFIQVSVDGDTSRGGAPLDSFREVITVVQGLEHLRFQGLMVVPPLNSDPKEVFLQVRHLVDELTEKFNIPLEMSAGMSADMAQAIESGTNIVRVGTGIMGPRPLA